MKLVFCGTPEFAVPTLRRLLQAGHDVALVLTQPDRAAGRGLVTQRSPVKQFALQHELPVMQPDKIRHNDDLRSRLLTIAPDAIVVVAYGRIIPEWMLGLPRLGNINLHGSLLPKYRGAAPVQWAIAQGEAVTGVTTMRLDAGLDTGDMLLARAVPIGAQEGAPEVMDALSEIGADLMLETLERVEAGTLDAVPQDHAQASLAPILTREDGRVDPARDATVIANRWRGFYPWPGAYTTFRGKKLILHALAPVGAEEPQSVMDSLSAGDLVVTGDQLFLRCGGNSMLRLDELQMEGRRRMPAAEFLRGYQVKTGERIG